MIAYTEFVSPTLYTASEEQKCIFDDNLNNFVSSP